MAYQTCDVLQAMQKDSGIVLQKLKVDGGASTNNFLMQFQSDVLNKPVERPAVIETTALGAAYLAGLAVGYWDDLGDIKKNCRPACEFSPDMEEDRREKLISEWHKAVNRSLGWEKDK